MGPVIKFAVILAVVVEIVSVAFAAAGLHQGNPMLGFTVQLVAYIGANVVCLFLALKATAAVSGYGKQLLNSLVFGVVAGVLVMIFSLLNLSVLFPHYIEQTTTSMTEFYESVSMPQDQLDKMIVALEARTPFSESRNGGIGTIVTSLVVGAIVANFKRKK